MPPATDARAPASPLRAAALTLVAAVFASLVATPAFPQASPREGTDFTIVRPPQPVDAPAGKVEVIEFFGYWCPACNLFEPTLRDWESRRDAKIQAVYVPIPTHFRAGQADFQKLYDALDAMGREKELRPKVFAAIHAQRSLRDTADAGAIADWVASNGIDRKAFVGVFDSFAVQSKVVRANQMASAYGSRPRRRSASPASISW